MLRTPLLSVIILNNGVTRSLSPLFNVDVTSMSPQEIANVMAAPVSETDHLYQYAIVRSGLHIPPGKLAAQSGHAFADSLYAAVLSDPIITAIGIGPCTREECYHITKKFTCV